MQKITRNALNRRIENFKEYAQQYSKDKLDKIEDLKKNLDRAQYKIAVVANMSAGKTALINALFGKDVLPSYNEATSDCAIYIHSRCPNEEKQAKIYFSLESKDPVVFEGINKDSISDLKQYAQKDSEEMDKRYRDVEKIELYHPFYNIKADRESVAYDVVFVDTPGPNNTGEYSEKHKDQTREALRDSDMVLFVFDYTQLDANLATDEQRLWKPILERLKKKKEDFCVYFVLNKIDFAIKDNFKDIDPDSENFYELKKEKWFGREKNAVEKLKSKLEENGVKDPKIFPVSSRYQLLKRLDKLNEDDEDELDSFEKRHFKRVFGEDEWESRLVEYLGIEKLEKSINHYIQNQVEQKIHKRFFGSIKTLIKEENHKIQTAIQTFKKPKDKALNNLRKAENLLKKEIPRISSQTQVKIDEIQKETQQKIGLAVKSRVQEKVYNEIDEIIRQTAHFAVVYAETGNLDSTKLLSENKNAHFDIGWNEDVVKTEIKPGIDEQQVFAEMEKYLDRCLLNLVRDYKDINTDIENIFHNYQENSERIIQKSEEELQKMISESLEIQIDEIRLEETDDLDLSVVLDASILQVECQEAPNRSVWHKLWNWLTKGKVELCGEKYYITVNVVELKKQLEKQTHDFFEDLKEKEIKRYGNTVDAYSEALMKVFEDFAQAKQKEINDLQGKIENINEEIKKLHQQEKELKLKLEKK